MKNGQNSVAISRWDSKKVFRAIEEGDAKAVRELLNGSYRVALLAQRLLIRRLKNDPDKFSPQQLGTILGICSDKAIALLKATKDLKTEEGKSLIDSNSDLMRGVRERQRQRWEREKEEREGRSGVSFSAPGV